MQNYLIYRGQPCSKHMKSNNLFQQTLKNRHTHNCKQTKYLHHEQSYEHKLFGTFGRLPGFFESINLSEQWSTSEFRLWYYSVKDHYPYFLMYQQ